MRTTRIEDAEEAVGAAAIKRSLSTVLETGNLAVNYYELEPDETVSFGYHAHEDQEELYCVLSGEITFETDDGEVRLGSHSVACSPPGEYKQGRNTGDGRATVLAVGAPREMGETEIRRNCPECGDRTAQTVEADEDIPPAELQVAEKGTTIRLRCVECGTETGRFE